MLPSFGWVYYYVTRKRINLILRKERIMKTNFSTLGICGLVLMIAVGLVWAEPMVEITGLSTARPDPTSKYNRSKAGNIPVGTHVYIEITDKTKNFLSFDDKASKLAAFTDDKGTDLTKIKKKSWGRPNWLGSFPKITDDKHGARFEIKSTVCPAKGATKVKIDATIVLLAGSGQKTETQEDVELKLDAKITIGPAPFTIDRIEKGRGSWKRAVTLFTEKPVDGIKSIKFYDADGKEIESKRTSRSTSNKNVSWTYSLKKKVDKATIKIEYYQKVEKITVPINISLGVGL